MISGDAPRAAPDILAGCCACESCMPRHLEGHGRTQRPLVQITETRLACERGEGPEQRVFGPTVSWRSCCVRTYPADTRVHRPYVPNACQNSVPAQRGVDPMASRVLLAGEALGVDLEQHGGAVARATRRPASAGHRRPARSTPPHVAGRMAGARAGTPASSSAARATTRAFRQARQ